MLNFNVTSQHA